MTPKETTATAAEETNPDTTRPGIGRRKYSWFHKIFGLKGLSIIYKALSVLLILFLLYSLEETWRMAFMQKAPKMDALFISFQLIVTFGFNALVLYTVAVVLKVLKKIKYAVEQK